MQSVTSGKTRGLIREPLKAVGASRYSPHGIAKCSSELAALTSRAGQRKSVQISGPQHLSRSRTLCNPCIK